MAVGMGGRSAEEIACEEITSGAQNDLQQVTGMARVMVTQLGMAEDLGPTFFGNAEGNGLDGATYNPWEPHEYSDGTARRIDEAVERFVNEAHDTARRVLAGNRAALDAVAEALMHEESLSNEQLAKIVDAHRLPGQTQPAIPQEIPEEPAVELASEVPTT
jgi:cell division protease FtsH